MFLFLNQYTKEFRYNLNLSYPVIIGLLGHTLVQFIDNIMVGQLGTAELASVSLGNSFFFIAMSLGIGFSTAITPLIAETDGMKNIIQGRNVFIHGLIICFFLGVLLSTAVLLSKPYLFQMGQQDEVVFLAYPYLHWVGISLIPLICFQGFKQFSEGLSMTRPAMYATLTGNLINVCLNYILIFGFWIFPKMGVEGAAIGTLCSRFFMLIFIALYIRFHRRFEDYVKNIKFKTPKLHLFKTIIRLGFPSALQMFFMGLGVVSMIRVGNQKGLKDFISLKRIAYSIFLLILIFDFIFCIFFLVSNEFLPWLYLDRNDPLNLTDVYEVVEIASSLLIISAFFQISDGIQAAVLGALRGLQDVNIPTFITFFSYGIFGIPISYYLSLETNLEALGIWIGLLSGLTCSALLLFLRFNYLTNKLITNSHHENS